MAPKPKRKAVVKKKVKPAPKRKAAASKKPKAPPAKKKAARKKAVVQPGMMQPPPPPADAFNDPTEELSEKDIVGAIEEHDVLEQLSEQ